MHAATGKGGPRIRLLVVPVLRDRWVFSVPHHAEALASHDTSPVSGWGPKGLQRKGAELLGRAKDSFDRLPREGLKGRLKAGVDTLNRRLDPSESMLKCLTAAHRCTVAPAADEVVVTTRGMVNDEANQPDGLTEAERELQLEVVYPAKLSGEQVRATLSQLVAARTKRHQNLAYGSTAMLPVSLAMGLLPGPNVFLAWNVYRLYSHVQALRGGKLFLDLSSRNRVSYSPSHELEEIIRTEERHEEPLSRAQIEKLSATYGLRTLLEDVERLRIVGVAQQQDSGKEPTGK